MEKKRMPQFKIRHRDIMLTAHFQFLFIWDAFGTVMKKTGNLCILHIISVYHSQAGTGVHYSHGMLKTIFIQILGKLFFYFRKIIICHGQTSFFL